MVYLLPAQPPFQLSLAIAHEQAISVHGGRASFADLLAVNSGINSSIQPERNDTLTAITAWRINPKTGWCGDYALSKQYELIRRGWPRKSLLLAEVIIPTGEHHAVLVAKLKVGYLVLDNLTNELRKPTNTGYHWVRMQNANDPSTWSAWSE